MVSPYIEQSLRACELPIGVETRVFADNDYPYGFRIIVPGEWTFWASAKNALGWYVLERKRLLAEKEKSNE